MSIPNFTAGGLLKNYEFWSKNITDPSILSLIKGLTLSFSFFPNSGSAKRENQFSDDEKAVIRSEIEAQLTQEVIEIAPNFDQNEYISTIFVVPKKDGGYRVILNLKHLNEFIEKSHFKMSSLNAAIDLMTKDCYMASVDFKSAYYSVSVREKYRKYLRFEFEGVKYQYTCLPMGLTTGPRDFTKIMKVIFRILREKGHLNTFYIDDSFLVGKTFTQCAKNVIDTVTLSSKAGFTVQPDKSVFTPSKTLKYLGVILNSSNMTVSLGSDKILSFKTKISSVLNSKRCTLQFLSELVGMLVASFCAVPYGKLYFRQLEI